MLIIDRLILLELPHVSKFVSEAIAPRWQLEGGEGIDQTLRQIHHPLILAEAMDLGAGGAGVEVVAADLIIQLINIIKIVAEFFE